MKKISESVLAVLDEVIIKDNIVILPPRQLDRKLYDEVNKVLEALGGRWNRKAKGHVFPQDPTDEFEAVLLTGEYGNAKQDFGFFETPAWLAEDIVKMAKIEDGSDILEPSAGHGSIADAIVKLHPACKKRLTLIEIQKVNVEVLTAKGYENIQQEDFLSTNVEGSKAFDRVVMNPPFAKQADIKHVLHAWDMLKPGGRLISIMSSGVTFRRNKLTQGFQDLVSGCGRVLATPEGAFKQSGTMVNTVTVILDKAA